MICLGTVYSWSLFTEPLIASFNWTSATTTWTFSVAIFFLGIGAIIGGRWQDQGGPRPVAVTGAILWGIGNILAGLGTARFGALWIYLTYGLLGGLGLGLAYITPVAAVTKWFPDRRGLGGGIVIMGFGLGAFIYNWILKSLPAYTTVAKHAADVIKSRKTANVIAMDAHDINVIMTTLMISGAIYLVVGGLCALYLSNPPQSGAPATPAASSRAGFFTPIEAAKTWQFFCLWMMLFLNVTAGILFISNAVPIMRELTRVEPAKAASVYGLIALFNGIGRFFWGAISDLIGRNGAYILIYGSQVAIFFTVGHLHSVAAVAMLFAIVLLCYGGGFGTMPSFTADYFGTKFIGLIYGWILLAWGVAGVVGPIFVAYVKDHTGSFTGALPVIAIMLIVATIFPIIVRKPAPKEFARVSS
jgi:MFS family permease